MVGSPSMCPLSAPVATASPSIMPYHVQKGAFPPFGTMRFVTSQPLLSEVCHNVGTEPHLQPLDGETFPRRSANTANGARLDIVANGFWRGRFERPYYDVRVFNLHTASNQQSVYRRHESLKSNAYVKHASFTPLVMSLTGGLGPAATTTYKHLASLLSTIPMGMSWPGYAADSPFLC